MTTNDADGPATGRIFLSYSAADEADALAVCTALERAGLPCWIVARDEPEAAKAHAPLVQPAATCRAFVVVHTQRTNKDSRRWSELIVARQRNADAPRFLLQVEPATVEDIFANPDFIPDHHRFACARPPCEQDLARLSAALRTLLEPATSSNRRAEHASDANAVMQAAIRAAESLPWSMVRGLVWKGIAATQAQAGAIDEAKRTAEGIDEFAWETAARYAIACVQTDAGDIEGATRTAAETRPGQYRDLSLASVARAQVKANDLAGAVRTAAAIDGTALREIALRRIVDASMRIGDFDAAIRAAHTEERPRQRATTLARIAIEMSRIGRREAAHDVLVDALQTSSLISDAAARSTALGDIAAAQIRLGDREAARRIAETMAGDLRRAAVLYDIAVAESRRGRRDPALKALDDAMDAARSVDDMATRESALRVLAAVRAQIADGGDGPDDRLRARFGDFDAAVRSGIVHDLPRTDSQPASKQVRVASWPPRDEWTESEERDHRLHKEAAEKAKTGDVAGALTAARAIEDDDARASALCHVACAQATAGDMDGASHTIAEMPAGRHVVYALLAQYRALMDADAAANGRPSYRWKASTHY
jgi:tetratricopeptide (TPR) repeat protein